MCEPKHEVQGHILRLNSRISRSTAAWYVAPTTITGSTNTEGMHVKKRDEKGE